MNDGDLKAHTKIYREKLAHLHADIHSDKPSKINNTQSVYGLI